jgi:hypothetical protein
MHSTVQCPSYGFRMLVAVDCSEADRLAVVEEEEKHAGALEGVDIEDSTIKAALLQQTSERN